jgi:activator of HSP90 ATPase
MKTKTIKQGGMFPASPERIYKILMDSKLHSKFTGDVAKISKKVGGKFSAFSGYITGKNLVLQPGKKIVQAWRGSEWPKGHMSEVTYLLKPAKSPKGHLGESAFGGKGGTKLMFTHKGVPANDYKDKVKGWKKYYWEPLKKMLEKSRKA